MFRYFKQLFLLGCLAGSISSCYNDKEEQGGIFRYNEASGIASLDPAFAKNQSVEWAVHQLYSTLVEIDSSLHIQPCLAKRWTISGDKKTYTFYLRSDVSFHNDACFRGGKGRRLTAADVVFSFNRLTDKATASPGSWIFNRKVESTAPFVALNDTIFQLQLIQPYQPILGILAMQYCSVVPHEALTKYGTGFRRHPVGSGPFRFVAWEEGQALVLKRNETYFETDSAGLRLPYLAGVTVSFYDSRATEFLLLRQKKLAFINDIDASFKDEVLSKNGTLRKSWEGKIKLQTSPYLNIEYFGILVDTTNGAVVGSPLRLQKVRQAINFGFDRRKLVLYLRNSLGIPAEAGFVPPGLPSFNDTAVRGYSYNPLLAKKLLAEAGFTTGSSVIKLLTIPNYADIAAYIARQLGEIGLNVQVDVVQKSLLLELTSSSRAGFFRGSWIADYPDAENYLSVFYSKNPAPPNYTRYHNSAFDALFEKAIAETDDSIRYSLYQQADQLMIKDAPVVPLWYDKVVRLVQPNVSGFTTNALNLLELRHTRINK